jgi:peptide/histidine transporter 3/4
MGGGNILTIAGSDAMIVGSGRATIILPMGTQITIEEALLYPDATRTLLSYKDIRCHGIHVETHEENKEEFLLFTKDNRLGNETLEMVLFLLSGLYIKPVPYVA